MVRYVRSTFAFACGLLLLATFIVSLAGAQASGLDGTWSMVSLVGSNDSVFTPDPEIPITYTFNTAASTVTITVAPRTPTADDDRLVTTLSYTVLASGNLLFEDDRGRSAEISYAISGDTLTLTTERTTGVWTDPEEPPAAPGEPTFPAKSVVALRE